MKNKILIIISVILVIAILMFVMYQVDMYMMDNNKPVVFSTWGYDYAPPEIIGNVVNIVDKTKENSDFACSMALEKIFEDENNEYFLNCIKSNYIIVKYENGYEEDVKEALKNENITINDLDRFSISYITEPKSNEYENSFIGTVLEQGLGYIIVMPNQNEFERKSADKFIINYSNENKNLSYKVGSSVVISYNGGIMETYPATVKDANISVLYE